MQEGSASAVIAWSSTLTRGSGGAMKTRDSLPRGGAYRVAPIEASVTFWLALRVRTLCSYIDT